MMVLDQRPDPLTARHDLESMATVEVLQLLQSVADVLNVTVVVDEVSLREWEQEIFSGQIVLDNSGVPEAVLLKDTVGLRHPFGDILNPSEMGQGMVMGEHKCQASVGSTKINHVVVEVKFQQTAHAIELIVRSLKHLRIKAHPGLLSVVDPTPPGVHASRRFKRLGAIEQLPLNLSMSESQLIVHSARMRSDLNGILRLIG